MYSIYICSADDDDGDYDDGTEESGKSKDWDMEPGDPGWLGSD